MRKTAFFLAVPVVSAMVAAAACSATTNRSQFTGGGDTGSIAGSGAGVGTSTSNGGSTGDGLGGGISLGDAGDASTGECVGLQCSAATDACTAKNKSPTTISGRVYDPAGAVPLYNVYVYIPNSTPDPIITGNPTCTQCEAAASGNPVVGALTDANGIFTLSASSTNVWGVPSGSNIPLVLQIGKWRRQLTIPSVEPCTSNALPDPSTPSQKLRLPAKTSEGDMPFIAFTSGCDPAECFLRHIGIDDSEFVPPGGQGHVNFYTGQDADSFGSGNASQVAGGNNWQDTYQWWTSYDNLKKYDIIFNACECNPNDRGPAAYTAMEQYLNGGGRVFATHYYYNWFAPPTGSADFQSVVQWVPDSSGNESCNDETSSAPYCNEGYFIDTSFPKGMAFAQWLQNAGVTTTMGQISLTDTRWDMNQVTSAATDWIYNAPTANFANYASMYMSFNTPVGVAATSQCGRAVFSDVHLSGTSDDSQFPNECANADPDGSHAKNEKALEFLFFDLSSCVQNESMPPPPPPPVQ